MENDYFFPKRNDSRIIGSSPFTPTSSMDLSSGAKEVVIRTSVTPFFPPSVGGRKMTRPQIFRSPLALLRDMLSKRNSYPSYTPAFVSPSDTFRYSGKFLANWALRFTTRLGNKALSSVAEPDDEYQPTAKFSWVKSGGRRRSTFAKFVAPGTPAFASFSHLSG